MSLDKQQKTIEKAGVKTIGAVIWWHLAGDFLRVHVDVLAKKHGLPPLKKMPRGSFTSALNEINSRNPNMIAKKVKEDLLSTIYVIADAKKKADELSLEFGSQSWVAFDKMSNSVTWREKDPRTEEFADMYRWYQEHYVTSDIRSMVEKAVADTSAVSLRTTGGVYFVPEAELSKINAVNKFLDELGTDSHITSIKIPDLDSSAISGIKKDFEQTAIVTVDGMMASINETLKTAKGLDRDQRIRMIRQLSQISQSAESMEALLHFKASKLNTKIKEIQSIIKDAAKLD